MGRVHAISERDGRVHAAVETARQGPGGHESLPSRVDDPQAAQAAFVAAGLTAHVYALGPDATVVAPTWL